MIKEKIKMARFRNSILGYNKRDVLGYIESLLNDNVENIEEIKKEKFKKEELLALALQENEKLKSQKEEVISVLAHAITESESLITNTRQQINDEQEKAFSEISEEVSKYRTRAESIKGNIRDEIKRMESERLAMEEKLDLLKKEYNSKVEKIESVNSLINIYKNVLNEDH